MEQDERGACPVDVVRDVEIVGADGGHGRECTNASNAASESLCASLGATAATRSVKDARPVPRIQA